MYLNMMNDIARVIERRVWRIKEFWLTEKMHNESIYWTRAMTCYFHLIFSRIIPSHHSTLESSWITIRYSIVPILRCNCTYDIRIYMYLNLQFKKNHQFHRNWCQVKQYFKSFKIIVLLTDRVKFYYRF